MEAPLPTPPVPRPLSRGARVLITAAIALGSLVVVLIAGYLAVAYNYQALRVRGQSMEPTLYPGNIFLAEKLHGDAAGLARCDIVSFVADGAQLTVTRIIAVPGDRLRVSRAKVLVNGRELRESYLPEAWTSSDSWNGGNEQVVPQQSYFVLGDNRNHSIDSRSFGYVRASQIRMKGNMRLLPRFGDRL